MQDICIIAGCELLSGNNTKGKLKNDGRDQIGQIGDKY
jgi:hypothetical protein